jgi:octaprenyl-diphosphate synthase
LHIVSTAVREMSEGELLQIEKARRLDIAEPVYFDIIRQKTASLIASCCACGAASASNDLELQQLMHQFGELTGIAFQIKDDLFDYGNPDEHDKIGKPTGIDIKEKKMTLPLIYALNNVHASDRKLMINIVKNHNEDPKKVAEVVDKVHRSGGIEYAQKRMYEYREKALSLLHYFPESPARQSLNDLLIYTTERRK